MLLIRNDLRYILLPAVCDVRKIYYVV